MLSAAWLACFAAQPAFAISFTLQGCWSARSALLASVCGGPRHVLLWGLPLGLASTEGSGSTADAWAGEDRVDDKDYAESDQRHCKESNRQEDQPVSKKASRHMTDC